MTRKLSLGLVGFFALLSFLLSVSPRYAFDISLATAQETPSPSDTEEAENEDDLWKGVDFTQRDMKSVINVVDQQYYNKSYNRKLSWIEAANYALMFSVKNKPMELMSEKYYQIRKQRAAEQAAKKAKDPLAEFEDTMEGETFKLSPKDKYLVRALPLDRKEKKTKRKLTDDELSTLDAREKERIKLKHTYWSELSFGEEEFNKVIQHLLTYRGKEDFLKDEKGNLEKVKKPVFNEKMMWIYASTGYLVSLDPHSSIISRIAWEKSTKSLEDSSFDGIGAILIMNNDYTTIENPIDGQPAAKAGLRAGDVIVKVDGTSTFKLLLPEVVKRIKGPKGTKVKLTIERPGTPEPFDVTVVRDHIEIKNVSSKLVGHDSKIGYLKLTGFIETSYDHIVEHYRKLEQQAGGYGQLRGVIIDLRGNSGGLLDQAGKIADLFVHRGKIVSVKYGNGREDIHQARAPDITKAPVIVLVNAMSASASEIFASAIQDHKRGLVVGERTFGKASVQQLIPNSSINHSYYTKITIARYYAPSGRTLQVIGVNPDLVVTPDVDGKFPYRFREENYAGHLQELDTTYDPPNKSIAQSLKPCVAKTGKADKVIKSDPNPQIKHDYQLLTAVDYMNCWVQPDALAAKQTSGTEAQKPSLSQ